MNLVIDALDAPLADRAIHCLSDGSHVFGAALRSAINLASLPYPIHGMGADEYLAQIRQLRAMSGGPTSSATRRWPRAVSGAHWRAVSERVRFVGLRKCARGMRSLRAVHAGQHRHPEGNDSSFDEPDADLTSMYGWLEPSDGAVICSSLPLSHDLGLIGPRPLRHLLRESSLGPVGQPLHLVTSEVCRRSSTTRTLAVARGATYDAGYGPFRRGHHPDDGPSAPQPLDHPALP